MLPTGAPPPATDTAVVAAARTIEHSRESMWFYVSNMFAGGVRGRVVIWAGHVIDPVLRWYGVQPGGSLEVSGVKLATTTRLVSHPTNPTCADHAQHTKPDRRCSTSPKRHIPHWGVEAA
jgi:hypothetical protein